MEAFLSPAALSSRAHLVRRNALPRCVFSSRRQVFESPPTVAPQNTAPRKAVRMRGEESAATTDELDESLSELDLASSSQPAPAVPISPSGAAAPATAAPSAFLSLGLSESFANALAAMNIVAPTRVQARAIPAVCGGADVIIGAATGSGKTLAYLLPVVQRLRYEEEIEGFSRVPRRPRALVLLPTRELTNQVLRTAKALSHAVKFRAVGLVGGSSSLKKQRDALASVHDVLICTTGRLLQHLEVRHVDLADVGCVIIDEVDTMFDAGFGEELNRVLMHLRRRRPQESSATQFVAVGATHPKRALELYDRVFPSATKVEVDLHRTPPSLEQRFVDVLAGDKTAELVSLLGEAERDGSLRGGRMIVFTNTTDSCRFLEHFLREKGYSTSSIHGEMPVQLRADSFRQFQDKRTQLLVCTDIAARGLDNLSIDHVVLFDFPSSAVDYLHRAGRTARAGARGRVTSLVTRRDRTLAYALRDAAKDRGDALQRAAEARVQAEERRREEERLERQRRADAELSKASTGGASGATSSTTSSSVFPSTKTSSDFRAAAEKSRAGKARVGRRPAAGVSRSWSGQSRPTSPKESSFSSRSTRRADGGGGGSGFGGGRSGRSQRRGSQGRPHRPSR